MLREREKNRLVRTSGGRFLTKQTRQDGPPRAVLECLIVHSGEGKQQTLFTIRRKIEYGKDFFPALFHVSFAKNSDRRRNSSANSMGDLRDLKNHLTGQVVFSRRKSANGRK